MASRLTVVVSQSAHRDPALTDIEETMVAELMMTPGLDATMIGPLEHIQPDDTDFLCVSSFQHNFVMLTWLEQPEVARHWDRLGLAGRVTPLEELASPAAAEQGRQIFHVRLTRASTVGSLVQRLKDMLAARQVKVVPLGAGSLHSTPTQKSVSSNSPLAKPSIALAKPAGKPDGTLPSNAEGPERANPLATESDITDHQRESLDQLVDDFDELDI